jgi:F0F1-type ATP synthase membrane subunit b/b'
VKYTDSRYEVKILKTQLEEAKSRSRDELAVFKAEAAVIVEAARREAVMAVESRWRLHCCSI